MIGVLSDAHGNISAFRSATLRLRNLGATRFFYLGDALGYIPSTEVVSELMAMGEEVQCISGNHEHMILNGVSNPKREPIYQHKKIREQLTSEQNAFLTTWSTHLQEEYGGVKTLYMHGGPDDYTNQYLYPDSDLTQFSLEENFVFMGHSHYPFLKIVDGTTFVNVGSCGLPRDDGRYGSFGLFDPQQRDVSLYRFSLENTHEPLVKSHSLDLHSSVLKLFERRSTQLIGQLLT